MGDVRIFLESQSRYDFDETVEKIAQEFQNRSWSLSFTHDLQQTLRKHGKEVLPVKVLALCHPKHSGQILDKDYERIISSMMPCRVSVYEKSDGKTYVSRINASIMADSMGGLIKSVMTNSSDEVEDILSCLLLTNKD